MARTATSPNTSAWRGVLNKRLKGREFVAGDYSIADMGLLSVGARHGGLNPGHPRGLRRPPGLDRPHLRPRAGQEGRPGRPRPRPHTAAQRRPRGRAGPQRPVRPARPALNTPAASVGGGPWRGRRRDRRPMRENSANSAA
ncbi:MAG: hypothetical protein WDM92_16160 [Caulobacteraceae bacterium]